jgi:cytochrome c biogenesis protein CcdA
MLGTVLFGAAAGSLSTLSPCVLPLLPVVLGTAASEHRLGPAALAGGLALSFAAVGMFVATIGLAIGLDASFFRAFGGALLVVIGAVLMLPVLQAQFATAAGPIAAWTESRFGGFSGAGLGGQFGVGLLLGAVWAPCVGPTLGAASLAAAQGRDLGQAAATMLAFGVGAAVPLLALGMLSREAMVRWRGKLLAVGGGGKQALGAVLALVGVLILSGLDKQAETWALARAPGWLVALTTTF